MPWWSWMYRHMSTMSCAAAVHLPSASDRTLWILPMSMMYGRYRTMMYEQYIPRVVMILCVNAWIS